MIDIFDFVYNVSHQALFIKLYHMCEKKNVLNIIIALLWNSEG